MTTTKNESGAQKKPEDPAKGTTSDENTGLKQKKKKYTKGTKRLQKGERDLSKAGRKLSKAVSTGISEYLDRRDKSATKRKDGAMVDLFVNFSRGFSEGTSKGAPALGDMAAAFDKMVNTKKNRKRMRRQIKAISRLSPLALFRM